MTASRNPSSISLETDGKTPYTSSPPSEYQREPYEQDERQIQAASDESVEGGNLEKQATNNQLEKQYSHLSQPARPDIPNGGLTAWLQVVAGFFLFFNSWGLINAFGVFQAYYKSALIPSQSNSNISWIGSIQAFLLCTCTIFAGPIFDRGHARFLVCTGSVMVVFGLMMVSICTEYWQLMLAQGLCMGIGGSGLFITSVAIVPSYFTTKRAFAIGIAASGSSLGGVIYPIVFHRLQPQIGFGWTVRVLGFMALATLAISCPLIKVRALPPGRRALVDFSGFKELTFTLFCLASFIGFIGLYIPFFYISEFASAKDGLGDTLAFYMLPILSSGSIVGRILPSFIADYVGPLNVLGTCTIIAGLLGLCWIAIHNTLGGLIVWAILYGAFSGAFVSLQPSTVVSITDDMSIVGGRLGMNTFCAALGLLIGSPIAGVLVGDGSWIGMQAFCGGTLLAGAALVWITRLSRTGIVLKSKA